MRILHFPVRSYHQWRRRVEISHAGGRHTNDPRAQELYAALAAGRLPDAYADHALSDAAAAAGWRRAGWWRTRACATCCGSARTSRPSRRSPRARRCRPSRGPGEAEELEQDGMSALMRSESIAVERLAIARRRSRRLSRRADRLRRRVRRLERRTAGSSPRRGDGFAGPLAGCDPVAAIARDR